MNKTSLHTPVGSSWLPCTEKSG